MLNTLMDKENYLGAANQIILDLNPILGNEIIAGLLQSLQKEGALANHLILSPEGIKDIKNNLEAGMGLLIKQVFKHSPESADIIEMAVFKALLDWNIPSALEILSQNKS